MGTFLHKHQHFIFLLFLIFAVIAVYFPVFNAEYLYTDEANQIWFYKEGYNYGTSVPQGRYLTYIIFEWVFSYINTVNKIIYARLFSLFGSILCLPVWIYILSKVANKNGHSSSFVMFIMIYLITMPPFTIYIGWSSCMQMFMACTSALTGGFLLYDGIRDTERRTSISSLRIILSVGFGLLSLFTYQSCFGCFLIPFLMNFIVSKKIQKSTIIGFAGALLAFAIYFVIFKLTLIANTILITSRSSFAINPFNKLLFLFTRPLASAFHFTYIFNEKSITGLIMYAVVAITWIAVNLYKQSAISFREKGAYYFGLTVFTVLIYLPSLIVKENYSSNRTLFALDLFIFILVADTFFSVTKNYKIRRAITCIVSILFLLNASYNYNNQFIDPLKVEFNLVNKILSERYKPSIEAIYFIRPSENTFQDKYKITSSWDEFGVPSTAKIWVPEPLVKQLIFEKTGSLAIAKKLIVKSWSDRPAFVHSGEVLLNQYLLIDMQKELNK